MGPERSLDSHKAENFPQIVRAATFLPVKLGCGAERPCALAGHRYAAVLAGCIVVCSDFSTAHAWTEAAVHEVSAHLDMRSSERVSVELRLRILVQRGWVEGFDIDGLGEHVQLDPERPATMTAADGSEHHPLVNTGRGRLRLSFSRHDTPTRGQYEAKIFYSEMLHVTEEQPHSDRLRVSWSLPPWQNGLDNVSIEIIAQAGAQAVDPDTNQGHVTADTMDRGTLIRFRRIHLPRTLPWRVLVDLPRPESSERAPKTRAADLVAKPSPRISSEPFRAYGPWWVVLLLGAIILAKEWLFERACREQNLRRRPWFGNSLLRYVLVVSACTGVVGTGSKAWWIPVAAWFSLLLLSGERCPLRSDPRDAPISRTAMNADFVRARRLRRQAWRAPLSVLDASSRGGIAVLTAIVVLCTLLNAFSFSEPFVWCSGALAAVLFGPIMLTRTPHFLPSTPEQRLLILRSSMKQSRAAPHFAFDFRTDIDEAGRLTDAHVDVYEGSSSAHYARVRYCDKPSLGGFTRHRVTRDASGAMMRSTFFISRSTSS